GESGAVGQGGGFNTKKLYDFPTIEWLAEVELRYELGPKMELVNIDNFLYDAAFDWDKGAHWHREEFREVRRSREYYRTDKYILRELYLDWLPTNWLVRVGKQQVGWGKMRGKVIDIINPERNYTGGFQTSDDYEWNRTTTWMTNATYYRKNSYLQFLWIPDYEANYQQARNGPFVRNTPSLSPTVRLLKTDRPSKNFLNHEFGINFDTLIHRWDFSAFYFYHWDDRPTNFRRGSEFIGGRKVTRIEPKPTRLHTLGTATDVNFDAFNRNWAYRIEGNYTLNDYFPQVNRPGRPAHHTGMAKRNWIHLAQNISTKFFRGEMDFTLQVNYLRLFGWDRSIINLAQATRPDRWILVASFMHPFQFSSDRLVGLVIPFYETGSDDFQIRIEASYRISSFLSFKMRYYGKEGPSDGGFGHGDDKDILHWELLYAF
ncbi:MAG: hypothetical protein QF619_11340, partial [Candidatus Binatia bacterium]|nr:hypothetical protein [Candidatus Binatia bacterium]